MTYILRFFILSMALCIIGCTAPHTDSALIESDTVVNEEFAAEINALIQSTVPRLFNGVILITQNGETIYSTASGFSDFDAKTPIQLTDNFRIQSNSKQITAALVLRAYERGLLALHTPIRDYLPDLEQDWADRASVHHLLTMSSGVANLESDLMFEPGTDYRYSNAGYSLLGQILEAVTGESYVDLAHALFDELSMHNSFCYEFGGDQNGLINSYTRTDDGYERVDFYARGITPDGWSDFIPAGGIISNAADLNIWDEKLHSGEIVNIESYALMTTISIRGQHAAFGDEDIGYGYGVRIDDTKHATIIGHAGKGIGFTNTKAYVPSKDLRVIVLENVYDDDPNVVYYFEKAIMDAVMQSHLAQ